MVEIQFYSGEKVIVDVRNLPFKYGGQSRVYVWTSKKHNKKYAIKVSYDDPDVLRRVKDIEKQILTHGEPPISVKYRGLPVGNGWGTKEEFGFKVPKSLTFQVLVYNYVEGVSLDDYLEREKPLSKKRTNMCNQLFDLLIYLQNVGVVHGDLFPDNFMIGADGRLYLMDLEGAGLLRWDRLGWIWSPTNLGKAHMYFCNPPEFTDRTLPTIFSDRWIGTYLIFSTLTGFHPMPFLKRIDKDALEQFYLAVDKNLYEWPPNIKGSLAFINDKYPISAFKTFMKNTFGSCNLARVLFATYVLGYKEPERRPDFQQVRLSLSGLI